jgi:hypothetical protein
MPKENALHAQYSEPISLSAFQSEVKHYRSILQEKELILLNICSSLTSSKRIRPDQYKRMNSLLGTMLASVRTFCRLLGNPALLPAPVVPNRYLLLATLQHMDERIQTLSHLNSDFRELRYASSERTRKLHVQIICNLELLLQNCQDVLMHFQTFSDQVCFEERRQASLSSDRQEASLIPRSAQIAPPILLK